MSHSGLEGVARPNCEDCPSCWVGADSTPIAVTTKLKDGSINGQCSSVRISHSFGAWCWHSYCGHWDTCPSKLKKKKKINERYSWALPSLSAQVRALSIARHDAVYTFHSLMFQKDLHYCVARSCTHCSGVWSEDKSEELMGSREWTLVVRCAKQALSYSASSLYYLQSSLFPSSGNILSRHSCNTTVVDLAKFQGVLCTITLNGRNGIFSSIC